MDAQTAGISLPIFLLAISLVLFIVDFARIGKVEHRTVASRPEPTRTDWPATGAPI